MTIVASSSGSEWSFEVDLLAPLDHVSDDQMEGQLPVGITVIHEDTTDVISNLTIYVEDDSPLSLAHQDPGSNPVDGSNISVSGTLSLNAGADGARDIVFSGSATDDGTLATDATGAQLYLDGAVLKLYGHGTSQMEYKTDAGQIALKVAISETNGAYSYTVTPVDGVITNFVDLGEISFSGFSGGNSGLYAIVDGFGSSTLDVVFTADDNDTNNNNTVNTNKNLLGVSAGQDLDFDSTSGDKLSISLQEGVTVTGSGGSKTVTQGTHSYASSIDIPVDAFDANAQLVVTFLGDNNASKTLILDGTDSVADSTGTYDGIFEIAASDIGFAFHTIEIEASSTDGSGASFKLGQFSLTQGGNTDGINLSHAIIASDSDGDSIDGVIDYTLSPAQTAPVSLDLDSDGFEYLSREAGVVFTDQSTGESVKTAWVGPDDGLLVIDANNSGTVDESREYVFTEWSETAATDMEAIAEVFDTNQDGVLDTQDDQWEQFRVWQDKDSDGQTDEGELVSLGDLMIESIDLTYVADSQKGIAADGDVVIHGQSTVTYTDGSTGIAEDASFAISETDLLNTEELLLNEGEGDSVATAPNGDAANTETAPDLSGADVDLQSLLPKVDDNGGV